PVPSAGSRMEAGRRSGTAPTAPDSEIRTRRGACIRRARLHARFGSPMPTNTTSPSRSSRAATAAIISSGVYASEAVIHPRREALFRLEPCDLRLFLQVGGAIGNAVHEFVEVALEPARITRDALPSDVEVVIAVVVPLRVGGMRAPRLDHHGAHDHGRNDRPVRIGADDLLIHELLGDDDHTLRREGRF